MCASSAQTPMPFEPNRFRLPRFPKGLLLELARSMPQRLVGALKVIALDAEAVQSPALSFDARATTSPSSIFLWFEGRATSYGEMRARVVRRAAALSALGVGWGARAAVMMQNDPAFVETILALSWLGATTGLVNTSLTGPGLRHVLGEIAPSIVIATRDACDVLDDATAGLDVPRLVAGDDPPQGWRSLADADASADPAWQKPPARTLGTELFAFVFTSGTTGLPKAGKILNARTTIGGYGFGLFTIGLTEHDVVYVCLPLFHASGLIIGLGSVLVSGGTLALSRRFSVSRFWDEVTASGATAFVYIGELCRYLVSAPPHPKERAHQLRRMVGNGMRPDVWPLFQERFGVPFVHEFYGATEGNVNMTNVFAVEGSVGRMPPIPHLDNALLVKFDEATELPARTARGRCVVCKRGEVGELLGRIDEKYVTSRFDGYVGEAATEKKIVRDVLKKGDAYFRSGDLMRKDAFGFYYFVDRIGDTFRYKGENVSTTEVQDVLSSLDEVEVATVYGVEIPGVEGRAGMVALTLKPGAHFNPSAFYEHASRNLPAFAVPVFVRLVAEAQITATFKLKKADLVAEGFDPHKVTDLVFFRDDRQRSYEPIDAGVHRRIVAGDLRF